MITQPSKKSARNSPATVLYISDLNLLLPGDAVRKERSTPLQWGKLRTPADTSEVGLRYQLRLTAIKTLANGFAILGVYYELLTNFAFGRSAALRGWLVNHHYQPATAAQIGQIIGLSDVRFVARAIRALEEVGLLTRLPMPDICKAVKLDKSIEFGPDGNVKREWSIASETRPDSAVCASKTEVASGGDSGNRENTGNSGHNGEGLSSRRPAGGQPAAGQPMGDYRRETEDRETPRPLASARPETKKRSAEGPGQVGQGATGDAETPATAPDHHPPIKTPDADAIPATSPQPRDGEKADGGDDGPPGQPPAGNEHADVQADAEGHEKRSTAPPGPDGTGNGLAEPDGPGEPPGASERRDDGLDSAASQADPADPADLADRPTGADRTGAGQAGAPAENDHHAAGAQDDVDGSQGEADRGGAAGNSATRSPALPARPPSLACADGDDDGITVEELPGGIVEISTDPASPPGPRPGKARPGEYHPDALVREVYHVLYPGAVEQVEALRVREPGMSVERFRWREHGELGSAIGKAMAGLGAGERSTLHAWCLSTAETVLAKSFRNPKREKPLAAIFTWRLGKHVRGMGGMP